MLQDLQALKTALSLYLAQRDRTTTGMALSVQKLFIAYLRHHKEGLPTDFDAVLDDVELLFDLLEP